MSISVMNYVWENSKQKGTTLLILLALADFSNDKGICWPSVKTLAKKARTSKRNTQFIIKKLVDEDEITIQEGKGPNGVHLYAVNMGGEKSSPPTDRDEIQHAEGVKSGAGGGEAHFMGGVKPISPKPSFNHHINHQEETSLKDLRSNERGEMLEAILSVCNMTWDTFKMNGKMRGLIDRTAKFAMEKELSPEIILELYGKTGWWWKHYWLGRDKGEPPRPEQIMDTLDQALIATGKDGNHRRVAQSWERAVTGEVGEDGLTDEERRAKYMKGWFDG